MIRQRKAEGASISRSADTSNQSSSDPEGSHLTLHLLLLQSRLPSSWYDTGSCEVQQEFSLRQWQEACHVKSIVQLLSSVFKASFSIFSCHSLGIFHLSKARLSQTLTSASCHFVSHKYSPRKLFSYKNGVVQPLTLNCFHPPGSVL